MREENEEARPQRTRLRRGSCAQKGGEGGPLGAERDGGGDRGADDDPELEDEGVQGPEVEVGELSSGETGSGESGMGPDDSLGGFIDGEELDPADAATVRELMREMVGAEERWVFVVRGARVQRVARGGMRSVAAAAVCGREVQ